MLEAHSPGMSDDERDARVRETLGEVALPPSGVTIDDFLRRYTHQLSGGQQQRVAIAMAFASRPHVIVCDEPTTGLDVTTQARVLTTIRELCQQHGVAALYVSPTTWRSSPNWPTTWRSCTPGGSSSAARAT